MLETLKKKSVKSYAIRAAVAFAVAVGILAVTRFAVFDLLNGTETVDFTGDVSEYEGKYVIVEADYVLTDYAEHTTTTTSKYGSKSTSVNGNSYIALQSVTEPGSEMDTWYFFSLYMKKSDQDRMYERIDEAWEYLEDATYTVEAPEPVIVRGTWTRMESLQKQYYMETLTEIGVVESEYDIIGLYTLETDKIGGQTAGFFWFLMAAALLLCVYALYCLAGIFAGFYTRDLNKYLKRDSSVSMASIEADFGQARPIGKNVWVGRKWTVFMEGPIARIVVNKDLVWGYYYRRTGRYSASQMRLFGKDKKMRAVNLTENDTRAALALYAAEQPQMITGYSKELEKLYNKDFAGFLNLKYNPAMSQAQEADYNFAMGRPQETDTQPENVQQTDDRFAGDQFNSQFNSRKSQH